MSGAQCCSNPPVLDPSCGAGHVQKLAGLDTYVTGSPDSKLAILLVSDVFGYDAPNLRYLADKAAATGFFVVVPDFWHGDPYVPKNAERPLEGFDVWLKDHRTDKAALEARSVIEILKSKGVSSVGAAGCCLGEVKGPITILGAEIDEISPPELIKQFEAVLAGKSGVEFFVKVCPKVAHGWTIRYDVGDEEAVKNAEEAHQILLEWFCKHVK
ncbi:endo-1,3;1,4-beta-D-glucanase-like isoform X2 [Ziziphus jujuba]|uniref:Endo-1,31,4-beta-D-glucanase-like isoform X2 n=1 Tax=Ziziphus jujuba TaxID=326968 RepID=A0ABM3IQ28_ZIZJJ|nr:endo-1,3;1,4-beta-D-glucanase-like isoform X2 [Ziziphus jujuba]